MNLALTQTQLTRVQCCRCVTVFAMDSALYERRLKDHGLFSCPNGHEQKFHGPTEADRLRVRLEEAQRGLDQARQQRNHAENRLRAQRAATSRVRNKLHATKDRVGNGVCPCCNRTFKQLAQHMKTKHPKYAAERESGDLEVVP